MVEFLETDRLILRPLSWDDLDRLFLLDSDPVVMKYVGVPPVQNIEQSKLVMQNMHNQYIATGIGRYAVIDKVSGIMIGWSGLKVLQEPLNGYQNVYELGYRFLPEFWGKGFATESGKAWLEFGFQKLNLPVIYACAHCENHASNHTLIKLGFQKTSEFIEPDGLCFWYEIRINDFDQKQNILA